jgi:hypothetical protein
VTPQLIDDPFKREITGPAVVVSSNQAWSGGRGEVAAIAAQLFPFAAGYVERVIENEKKFFDDATELEQYLATPRFTADRIIRRSETLVAFVTPGSQDGLGTFANGLIRNEVPIEGLAILRPHPQLELELIRVTVRLPADVRDLTDAILSAVESDRIAGGEVEDRPNPDDAP